MHTESMTFSHRGAAATGATSAAGAPWEWPLRSDAATRLPASSLPRWLAVTAGRVWLTRSGAGPDAADVWLQAGERHALPAGSEWVAEGWPRAQVALLEAPVPAVKERPAPWGWLRRT